jgi:hypothetical protein
LILGNGFLRFIGMKMLLSAATLRTIWWHYGFTSKTPGSTRSHDRFRWQSRLW